jgi:inosine-uridine nucleoside N-ribohydrolase
MAHHLIAKIGAYACCALSFLSFHLNAEPVKVIWDSDLGCDIDDAGCGAVLHGLQTEGAVEIIGAILCTTNPTGAAALDAINTFYGRSDIPVGELKGDEFLSTHATFEHYTDALASGWPNKFKDGADAPDAVSVYRKILAAEPDYSVVILTEGPLRNMSNLVNSGPDEFSDLNGHDLIAKKVKYWACMGGFFGSSSDEQKADGEWNFKQDGGASANSVNNWPTPIIFSGAEVGSSLWTGKVMYERTTADNPIHRAYENSGDAHDHMRDSWDQTIALYVGRGLADYYTSVSGRCSVSGNGANGWQDNDGGSHSYLVKKASHEQLAIVIEDLMSLPPGTETPIHHHEFAENLFISAAESPVLFAGACGIIRYRLPSGGRVRLTIRDLKGRTVVATLVDKVQEAGSYQKVWTGTKTGGGGYASNGHYLCVLSLDGTRLASGPLTLSR